MAIVKPIMRQVQVYDITEAEHTWAGEWITFSYMGQAAMADWKKAAPDFSVAVKTQHAQVRRLLRTTFNERGHNVIDEKFIAISPRLYEFLMAYMDEEIREKLQQCTDALKAEQAYNEARSGLLKQSQALYADACKQRAEWKDKTVRFINAPWYRRVWHAITLKELP